MTEREPLEAILQPATDEARIASTWQRIRMAQEVRPRVAFARWGFGLAAVAAAGVALVLAWPSHDPTPGHAPELGPLASRDVGVVVTAGAVLDAPAPHVVSLDDGSRVELGAGSRLEVLTNESDRFVTLLRHGRAQFDVHPGGSRRWEIETARAMVEVVGTQFVVDADDHRLVVEVTRGVVMVRGERVPGRVVRLTAGQHLTIEDPVKTAVAVPAVTPAAPVVVVPAVASKPPPKASKPARPSVATASPATTGGTLQELMAQADGRQAAGDPAGAAALLERALGGLHEAESVGIVEFKVGKLYLDELDAPDRAAAAFAKVIASGSPQALLEQAHARRIKALLRGNHQAEAAAALADYERAYPQGIYRPSLHKLVQPSR